MQIFTCSLFVKENFLFFRRTERRSLGYGLGYFQIKEIIEGGPKKFLSLFKIAHLHTKTANPFSYIFFCPKYEIARDTIKLYYFIKILSCPPSDASEGTWPLSKRPWIERSITATLFAITFFLSRKLYFFDPIFHSFSFT